MSPFLIHIDCKLNQTSQVEITNKKKSQAKKITGFQVIKSNSTLFSHPVVFTPVFEVHAEETQSILHLWRQFSPWNPSEVLITSADSRVRILESADITHKFRGKFQDCLFLSYTTPLDLPYDILTEITSFHLIYLQVSGTRAVKLPLLSHRMGSTS